MAEARVERRLTAILAGDIAGYSRLGDNDELGPSRLSLQVTFAMIATMFMVAHAETRDAEPRSYTKTPVVFFGSDLLFLAMPFGAAAAGALIISFEAAPAQLINSATFHFARATAYSLMNIYTIKMAGVFMITTSTIAIYTGFAPRWLAMLGYALSLLLLFGSYYLSWSFVVFPLWVFVMSIYIFFRTSLAVLERGDKK